MIINGQTILNWIRPINVTYPKVWRTFEESDSNSNKSVEYRIQDLDVTNLTEIGAVLTHMRENYIKDEPLSIAFGKIARFKFLKNNNKSFNDKISHKGTVTDEVAIEDTIRLWIGTMRQKMVLVCYKTGSDKIVGVNMNLVKMYDDFYNDWSDGLVNSP